METVIFVESVNYYEIASYEMKTIPRINEEISFAGIGVPKTYKVVSVHHKVCFDGSVDIRVFVKPVSSNETCYYDNMMKCRW